jgi:hypothetical protein
MASVEVSLGVQAQFCARHGTLSHCIIFVDPVPANPDSTDQFMGVTIVHRLAAGKGDDAVVLRTRLVIR